MSEAATAPAPARKPRDLHERDRRRAPRFPPGPGAQQWMIVVLLVAGVVSLVVKGADSPADPFFRTEGRAPVEGFGEIAFRVDTVEAVRCALLAQTALQQSRGLMGRTDLGGYDGMLFAFPADTTTRFFMRATPLALSIAWFDAGGRYLAATDMEPCDDRPDCPDYPPPGPYRYALEVPQGSLPALGVGPRSVLSVGGPCE